MQQGTLNLLHPISAHSVSRASIFTMDVVTSEVPEEFATWTCFTSGMYLFREIVCALLWRLRKMEEILCRFFLYGSNSGIYLAFPRRILFPYLIILL